MGLISYLRAGSAKREARAALRAAAIQGRLAEQLQAENANLSRIVHEQARAIARLERELAELRRKQ